MLAGHEDSDHHVGYLLVWDGRSVAVDTPHQVPDHVRLLTLGFGATLPALVDDLHVDRPHLGMGGIAPPVVGQRSPGQDEVQGAEAEIEVVVKLGEFVRQSLSDLDALKGSACRVDGDLGQDGGCIDHTGLALEGARALDVVQDLLFDQAHVRFEGMLRKAKFDKLLLLDELRIGTVVDDVASEYGGREWAVDLLRIDVLELAVEDEIVAFDAEIDGNLPSEQDKGEYLAILSRHSQKITPRKAKRYVIGRRHLFAAVHHEVAGVPAIGNRISDEGHPVKNQGRLGLSSREELTDNIGNNDDGKCTDRVDGELKGRGRCELSV